MNEERRSAPASDLSHGYLQVVFVPVSFGRFIQFCWSGLFN